MRCIFFLLSIVNTSYSQSNFLIQKFQIENISSENVNSIFLDKNNFFWLSTPEGLNRYDGDINSIFKSNPFDSTTLSNNLVYETFQIDNKGLYVKSSSGLDYFSYSRNGFIRTPVNSPIYHVNDENHLYLSSKNDGVFILNFEDNTSNNLKFDPRNPLSISSSNFTSNQNEVILPLNDFIWIGTIYGLNKYNIESNLNKRFYQKEDESSLNSNFINDLFYVNKKMTNDKIALSNKILAATTNGLSLINPTSNEIKNYSLLKNTAIYNTFLIGDDILIHTENGIFLIDEIDEENISLIKIINSGKLTKTRKITDSEFILYSNSNSFKRIIKNKNEYIDIEVAIPTSVKINDIRNYKGAYYISTESGVFRVTEKLNSLTKRNDNLLSDEKLISIQENDYYRVLLTNFRILLYEEDELSSSIDISKLIGEKEVDNATIYLDEDEYLFFGTNKLFIIDLYTDEILTLENSKDGLNSIMEGEINNLSLFVDEDYKKELWISLSSGISILNVEDEIFRNFKFNPRSKNKLPNGFSSILKLPNEEILISNINTGLYRYSKNLELIKHYIFDINNKTSITSSAISSLIDYSGEIYIGTNGDGLFIYENDSTGFRNFTTNNGLLSNNVLGFLKTYQHLFILSDKGINYFDFEVMSSLTDGNNNNLRNINEEDGLELGKFLNNGLSFYDDFLYVFSEKNIEKIDFYNLFIDHEMPVISLVSSKIIDENYDEKQLDIRDSVINLTDDITNIELNLSSPSFYKTENTQLFYKLEPLTQNWINLGVNRKAIIQSSGFSKNNFTENKLLLPYGDYKLRIKSTNSSGIESKNQLTYNIYVKPPWYLTIYAIISYIILAFSSIYLYVKYSQGRTKKLMEDQRKEEELEEAHNLQMGLLAKENPKRKDLDISTYIKCATEVGGDYYDFIEFEDGSLLVICGDATGHGTASGMMVSITKAGLLGIDSKKLNLIMKTLNKIIKKVDIGRLRMSLNLAHFQNGTMKLSSAAMPPIYHFENKTKKVDEIQISNLPLGGLIGEEFTVLNKKFSKGDVLVMISDGLPEAPNKNGELLDYQAVKECVEKNSLKSAEEIKNELVKLSDNWLDGIHNPDDITIVVCKKLVS
ncbi:MAG: SpoIIE family protein phosphatase [Cytophagales bacterium]